jgi:hypothetical protein
MGPSGGLGVEAGRALVQWPVRALWSRFRTPRKQATVVWARALHTTSLPPWYLVVAHLPINTHARTRDENSQGRNVPRWLRSARRQRAAVLVLVLQRHGQKQRGVPLRHRGVCGCGSTRDIPIAHVRPRASTVRSWQLASEHEYTPFVAPPQSEIVAKVRGIEPALGLFLGSQRIYQREEPAIVEGAVATPSAIVMVMAIAIAMVRWRW